MLFNLSRVLSEDNPQGVAKRQGGTSMKLFLLIKHLAVASVIGALGVPLIAAAELMSFCAIAQTASSFVNVFAYFVFVVAIASILYSALLFLISGGNEQKVASARSALIWGIVGIAVALFASYAIPFVQNIIGGTAPAGCGVGGGGSLSGNSALQAP